MTFHRAAILVAVLTASVALSGCIMYVGPHSRDDMTHDTSAPAPDEKPADTLPSNPT